MHHVGLEIAVQSICKTTRQPCRLCRTLMIMSSTDNISPRTQFQAPYLCLPKLITVFLPSSLCFPVRRFAFLTMKSGSWKQNKKNWRSSTAQLWSRLTLKRSMRLPKLSVRDQHLVSTSFWKRCTKLIRRDCRNYKRSRWLAQRRSLDWIWIQLPSFNWAQHQIKCTF